MVKTFKKEMLKDMKEALEYIKMKYTDLLNDWIILDIGVYAQNSKILE